MNKKITKPLKVITIFILIVSLTLSMTGCGSLQQAMQSIIPTEEPTKLGTGNSDTGFFVGERYEELPTINHRTEEEIAQTGLTAQDVLNAYDQLATDIMKEHYSSDFYVYLPNDVRENVAGRFESITPWSYETPTEDGLEYERFTAPFYAINPNFMPDFTDTTFPSYPVTINQKAYVDGVAYEKDFFNAGVEVTQFEKTMDVFGQKTYFLDYDTFVEQVEKVNDPVNFWVFIEQDAYEPIEITRETIMNATPEQLQALYNMISSIRSINLEQKLPE